MRTTPKMEMGHIVGSLCITRKQGEKLAQAPAWGICITQYMVQNPMTFLLGVGVSLVFFIYRFSFFVFVFLILIFVFHFSFLIFCFSFFVFHFLFFIFVFHFLFFIFQLSFFNFKPECGTAQLSHVLFVSSS